MPIIKIPISFQNCPLEIYYWDECFQVLRQPYIADSSDGNVNVFVFAQLSQQRMTFPP